MCSVNNAVKGKLCAPECKNIFFKAFFVQLLGIKLKISISKMVPITASFLQNSCDTNLYKSHLFSGDGISWV